MTIKEILYYSFRIIKWKLGNRSPFFAVLKLTYRCNLKCLHCQWQKLEGYNETHFEIWESNLYKLYKLGVRFIAIEGGEPTLVDYLGRLIEFAKKIGFFVALITNGTRSLTKYEPDVIFVSIDGSEEFHNLIRGKGCFAKIANNLLQVNLPRVALTTINKLNQNSIDEMLTQIEPFVDGIAFSFMYAYNKNQENLCLTKLEIESFYNKIIHLSLNHEIINTNKMLESFQWNCHPWATIVCEPDASWKKSTKCFIENAGAKMDCRKCHLACYRGFSTLIEGDINTWYQMYSFLKKNTKIS